MAAQSGILRRAKGKTVFPAKADRVSRQLWKSKEVYRHAKGETKAEIIQDLNRRKITNLTVKRLKKAIREAEHAIENLWRGIESGQGVDMLMERINQRQAELEELKVQLTIEESKKVYLTEPQILAFLDYVSETAFEDVNKKRAIINIFVNCVYLYDDHYKLILNTGKKPVSKENIPFEDIKAALNAEKKQISDCSSMSSSAPPY